MELPSTILFLAVYFSGSAATEAVPLLFLGMWQCHYLNRTFVYSLRTKTAGKKIPVVAVVAGFVFNTVNAYINSRFVLEFGEYGTEWLGDPRFVAGLAVLLAGLALNVDSDNILLALRKRNEARYVIPRDGPFRYVSCPNYLGEVVEWCGWSLATWPLPGLAFFVFTATNLVPRAVSHHRWYRARFSDYPARRKAILPGLI